MLKERTKHQTGGWEIVGESGKKNVSSNSDMNQSVEAEGTRLTSPLLYSYFSTEQQRLVFCPGPNHQRFAVVCPHSQRREHTLIFYLISTVGPYWRWKKAF